MLSGIEETVKRALAEDIGSGDVTTLLTVPPETRAHAVMVVKSAGVIAGLPLVAEVYRQIDPSVEVANEVADGASVEPGAILCRLTGSARSLLTGERVALNFVQRLSGVATKTSRFVRLVADTDARIIDTRKTTPGLRALEKYAVRMGGGFNHRFGLYDAVLIKDNHLAAGGGVAATVRAVKTQAPHVMTITVECDTLAQVEEAIEAGADILLLDNMTPDEMAQAVKFIDGRALTEASGGINEQTVAAAAHSGVDVISVGALTHSAVALDIGLDLTLAL